MSNKTEIRAQERRKRQRFGHRSVENDGDSNTEAFERRNEDGVPRMKAFGSRTSMTDSVSKYYEGSSREEFRTDDGFPAVRKDE